MTYRNVLLFGTALAALSATLPASAGAQASPSAFTAGMRYDAARRVTGTISPDPDGAGPLPFRAVRNTYDAAGRLTRVERGSLSAWQSEAIAPASWTGFTVLETVQSFYDNGDRKIRDIVSGAGTVYAVTDFSYDTLGRPRCTAVRMNPAIFPSATGAGGSLPADACTAGTASPTYGPDRITRTARNWRGDVVRHETGLGTSERRDVAYYNYTLDGQVQTITDANGNMSSYAYDGHDRLVLLNFPSPTVPGAVSLTDYERYTLDENGNRTVVRRRDGQEINQTFDALNRMTSKDLPGTGTDVTYAYDNLGRMLSASDVNGHYASYGYDALGRVTSESSLYGGTLTSQYDAAGRRSRLTWPDGFYVGYDYLDTGEMTHIRENGASSGIGVLATFAYDGLGRRTALVRGNGTSTTYAYDGASRLTSLAHDFPNPGSDLTLTLTRNPAGQITTRTGAHGWYVYQGLASGSTVDTHNGLNQVTASGGTSVIHDARGNMTTIGPATFGYDAENRMTSASGAPGYIYYEPMGRLSFIYNPAGTTINRYDGDRLVGEFGGGVERRYIHGPGTDEPLVWYEGAGTGSRRWLHADEHGSIIALSDQSGAVFGYNAYDEYGRSTSSHPMPLFGRFGYTGQAWLPEIGMYYYKARIYNPALGRFMQTDPSGYADGPNIYGYVGGDPINLNDPTGMYEVGLCGGDGKGRTSAICSGASALAAAINAVGQAASSTIDAVGATQELAGDTVEYAGELVEYAGETALSATGLIDRPDVPMAPAWSQECGCLEAGTLVSTPTGLRPIEQIRVGDLVIAVNQATGETTPKAVIDLIRPEAKPLYALRMRNPENNIQTFYTTDDHPWLVTRLGWVETTALRAGDRIATASDRELTVTSVSLSDRVEQTYTLTVADWHTYLVGHDQAVVHNRCIRFADLRQHARDHAEALGLRTVRAYYQAAVQNARTGWESRFHHRNEIRLAHVSRHADGYTLTVTNTERTRIYTHFLVGRDYLIRNGIQIPRRAPR